MPIRTSKRKTTEAHKVPSKKSKGSPRAAPRLSKPKLSTEKSEDENSPSLMWLDALPQDVCCRIAAYITRDRYDYPPQFLNEDALALALTSPKQRNAMAEALDHTPDLRHADMKSWLGVFEHPTYIDARDGHGNAVLELLSRASLRSALIVNRGNQFKAIATGDSVADLSIHLERLTEARFITMLDTLKKLTQLVALAIICDPDHVCAFDYNIAGRHGYQRLADACPRLTALHMICQCDTQVDHSPVVDTFPSLKEISVSKSLPDAALPYMRSRESVILQSHRKSLCCYASEIGAAVTGIKFPKPTWSNHETGGRPIWMSDVTGEEIAMLKNCPRLRELELLLHPGAEKSLPETKLLISLQLIWSFENRGFEENAWLGKPLDGSFVRRKFAQPLLQKLTLVGACIRMDDLEAVLRAAGKSLEELLISIAGQPDSILDRTLGILDKVILYNDKLQEMRIVEPDWIDCADTDKLISNEPVGKKKAFPARFRKRVCKLQRKNPWFDHSALSYSASEIVSHCEDLLRGIR